jgi:hypothetical protein
MSFILLTCSLFLIAEGTISNGFYNFMKEKHGKEFADSVARKDFGSFGSFGGGSHKAGERTK